MSVGCRARVCAGDGVSVSSEETDVVVVGGGAIGVCVAWSLVQRGVGVVVIERAPRLGSDTAAGSGGLITPSHCIPLAGMRVLRELPRQLFSRDSMISVRPRLDTTLVRFAAHAVRRGRPVHLLAGLRALRDQSRASRGRFERLAEHGVDVGLRHSGVLNVCNTREGFARLTEEAHMLEQEGFSPTLLRGAEVSAVEPTIRDDLSGAVLWEEDDHCVPSRLTPELGAAAERLGVRFQCDTTVLGFARDATGAVAHVSTDRGSFRADHVVLAAGAETPRVARLLGVRVPVQAGKGHHIDLHDWPTPIKIPMILHEDVLGVTTMGTDLRLVGGMDFVGIDRAVNQRRITDIYERSSRYLRQPPDPGGEAATLWCGLRPCAPDGLPIVGRLRSVPNAIVATGHGMLGLTLAPQTGDDVARLVVGDPRALLDAPWLAVFAPGRFGI